MSFVTRGFRGRGRNGSPGRSLPPGQYLTEDFPVLSYGPTPHVPAEEWSLRIGGEIDEPLAWSLDELPSAATRLPRRRKASGSR